MKNFYKLAAFCITILMFTTACTSTNPTSTEPNGTENSTVEDMQVSADSILDDQLFGEAVATNDLSKCEKISENSKAEECTKTLNANLLTTDAQKALDEDICDEIELDRYKENCVATVKSAKTEAENAAMLEKTYQKDRDLAQAAYDQQDPTICKDLSDESLVASCEFNTVIDAAQANGDSQLCDVISDEFFANECKAQVAGQS